MYQCKKGHVHYENQTIKTKQGSKKPNQTNMQRAGTFVDTCPKKAIQKIDTGGNEMTRRSTRYKKEEKDRMVGI
jgi:hypothetical protein